MEQAIKLLAKDGFCGLIVPNAWLMVYSGQGLRKYILDNCQINKIINLAGYSFENVNVETVIVITEKKDIKLNHIDILLTQLSHIKPNCFLV